MTHVDTEVLVRENAECKELLLEGMYHLNFSLTYMNYNKKGNDIHYGGPPNR